MLLDNHAHLCDPAFADDLDAVLDRARAAGVRGVVAVGETLADARRTLAIARRHPDVVRPCAGLFPTVLDADEAAALRAWIREHRDALAGIGEVGLDHWKVQGDADRALQAALFAGFVDLAVELDLPLNVHSRSAGRPTIELLRAHGARRVLLHAFDGRAVKARPAVDEGYFFSVPPSIVRSRQKHKLVRQLPLECLLLESDAPVLGPDPDARNEPANVAVALAAIASIKDLPEADVAAAIEANERRLWGA